MGSINTNLSSLIAQQSLLSVNNQLVTSLQRLSTGLRINTAADDPSGLIASLALAGEQTGFNAAMGNAQQATNMLSTADGALSQIGTMLTQLQGLVVQSANTGGLSPTEIQANQSQVDSILTSIDQLANATSFNGTNLLDGAYAYSTSGAAASAFSSLTINSALTPQRVVVQVVNSATLGQVLHTGTSARLGASAVTLQITGAAGTQQLTFAASAALSQVASAVNGVTALTGVKAAASGTTLAFHTANYGSQQFVTVAAISGTFSIAGAATAHGADAKVNVNGAAAQASGLNVSFGSGALALSLQLSPAMNAGKSKTFEITGGGASFSLGSSVSAAGMAGIGIPMVNTGSLGDSSNGFLSTLRSGGANSMSGNLADAQTIVSEAQSQVSRLRGQLGAFQQDTLGSTLNSLSVAYENVSSAQSAILDTNFAQETANFTRLQLLQQSDVLAIGAANSTPQLLLTLLRPISVP